LKTTPFIGGGKVHVERVSEGSAAIVVDAGEPLSGVQLDEDAPKTNYEISLEALRSKGRLYVAG